MWYSKYHLPLNSFLRSKASMWDDKLYELFSKGSDRVEGEVIPIFMRVYSGSNTTLWVHIWRQHRAASYSILRSKGRHLLLNKAYLLFHDMHWEFIPRGMSYYLITEDLSKKTMLPMLLSWTSNVYIFFYFLGIFTSTTTFLKTF